MNVNVKDNKLYERVSLDSLEFHDIVDRIIDEATIKKLFKDIGLSYDMYEALSTIDTVSADNLAKSMANRHNISSIILLVNKAGDVLGYSLDQERTPILNSDFFLTLGRISSTSDHIKVSEVYYHPDENISTAIIKRVAPMRVTETYIDKDSKDIDYEIGILLVNDETSTTYSRLVIYLEGQPLYLPASYYNTTTTRYKRSTSSSIESLEVLLLKTLEDLREDVLLDRIKEIHYIYRANKYIASSYEEYNTLLRTMRKIPTIIEDNSWIAPLLEDYDKFETKYAHLDDKKSSYIWRCTAIGEPLIGELISKTSQILTSLDAPAMEYYSIRELLGSYLSTNRIAEDIAIKEE